MSKGGIGQNILREMNEDFHEEIPVPKIKELLNEVKTKMSKEEEWTEDPDVQDFLERADNQGEATDDDKVYTVGGLANDKEGSFMKWLKQLNVIKEYKEYIKRKNKTQ